MILLRRRRQRHTPCGSLSKTSTVVCASTSVCNHATSLIEDSVNLAEIINMDVGLQDFRRHQGHSFPFSSYALHFRETHMRLTSRPYKLRTNCTCLSLCNKTRFLHRGNTLCFLLGTRDTMIFFLTIALLLAMTNSP